MAWCCLSGLAVNGIAANFESEQWKLKNISVAIYAYMQANDGKVPSNLEKTGKVMASVGIIFHQSTLENKVT